MKQTKKIGVVVLALVLMLGLFPTARTPKVLANYFENPYEATLGIRHNGEITESEQVKYYKFELPSAGRISVDFESASTRFGVQILDTSRTELFGSWHTAGRNTFDLELDKGTYIIKFVGNFHQFNDSEYFGNYNFRIDFFSAGVNHAEPNNSFDTSASVSIESVVKGHFALNNDIDYYTFELPSAGRLTVNFESASSFSAFGVQILNSAKTEQFKYTYAQGRNTFNLELDKGAYIIKFVGSRHTDNNSYSFGNYNFTLSFKDTYTVTFISENKTIATQTVKHGENAVAPQPIRIGYTFDGWDKVFTNVKSDLTVNAKWKINTYTVTFKNGKTVISTQKVDYGKFAYTPYTPNRIGYDFKGWDKKFDKITSNLIVNAKWKAKTIKLNFNANGGKIGKKKSVTVKNTYGTKIKFPKNPTRKGQKFKGWYTSIYTGTKATKKTKVPAYNTTYYARWVKK